MRSRIMIGLATVALVSGGLPGAAVVAAEPAPAQFRAYWVDAFGEGLYSRAEVEKLVAAPKAANMNAIVAQIGRRGDCLCNRASMPRTQAAIAPLPYDPLDTLIASQLTDGTGWFGFVDLAPGRYKIKLDGSEVHGHRVIVFTVAAGGLTTLQIRPNDR